MNNGTRGLDETKQSEQGWSDTPVSQMHESRPPGDGIKGEVLYGSTNDVVISKAPTAKHFARLQACLQEYLDDGDEFSGRQAKSILDGMTQLLGPDIKL